ncbi:MAG: hypothetical protein K2N17_06740, partial [Clostridia bacterium]|nr:hypothetical protein [Clostridia bacterium]
SVAKFRKPYLDKLAAKVDGFNSLEDMVSAAENGTIKTSEDFGNTVVSFGEYTFNGVTRELTWIPVYLSKSGNDAILTLWLANSAESNGALSNQETSSYSNGGYTNTAKSFTEPSTGDIVSVYSNSYDGSYIRNYILNGNVGYTTWGGSQVPPLSNTLTKFTQLTDGTISPYIVTPSVVDWQTNAGYLKNDPNYTGVANYPGNWVNDKIWLPSVYEVFESTLTLNSNKTNFTVNGGLWKTGDSSNKQKRANSTSTWLRSGYSGDYVSACFLANNGEYGAYYISDIRGVRPALHLNLSMAAKNVIIDSPQSISTQIYDGTSKWIDNLGNNTPTWLDTSVYDNTAYMTPTIEYTNMNGAKSAVTKEQVKDAGTYKVTMSLTNGLKWADGSGTGTRQFTITIGQATPTVDPTFPSGRPFVTSGFPQPTSYTATSNGTNITGTFEWINQNQFIEANKSKEYEWTFKPDNDNNFKQVTGKATLNFQERVVVSRTYAWKSEYTSIYTATTDSQLMDMIKLEVVYNDSPTPVIETNFEILGSTLVAGFGNSEVTVKFGNAIETISIPSTVEVVEAAIESLTVIFVQSGKVITVETPLDELKNCLTVFVKWNYTDEQDEVNKADYTVSGTLGVNGSNVNVVYNGVSKPVSNITVTKATYNMTAATAAATVAQEQVYSGSAQAFVFDDTKLPNGITVDTITYTNTEDGTSSTTAPTNAGVYTVTVSFNQANSSDYNKVTDITSKLTIKQAKVTGISFEPAVKPEITGETYTLEATGVPSWVTVTYSVEGQEGTSFSAAGTYKFTATFTHNNPNYEQIKPMTAMLTISDKPKVEGADDIVVEQTISATYTGSPVDYSAKKVPEGVGVSYEILKDGKPFEGTEIIEVGEYTITVIFDTGAANAPIAEKTCVVTISQGTYDMDGVELTGSRTVIYDGDEHELTLTGTLPDGVEYTVKYYLNGEETTPKAVGTYDVIVSFTNPDPVNYKDIRNIEATLTISDAAITGIFVAVEDGARFDINNTLDDVKAKIKAEISFNNGTNEAATEFTLTCEGLRDGLLDVGKQIITVTYNDGTQDYTTTVEIEVAKAKIALPVYKGTLSYSGDEIKPTAADFEGFDGAIMAFVESKTVAGLNAGTYKAVFALTDTERYEWVTATTLKKALFAVALYDLEAGEAEVEWTLEKAVITATMGADGKPVFKSEGISAAALAQAVGLKYFTDEACTQEVAADALDYETTYYMQADLLDSTNFKLDKTVSEVVSAPYTTPAKELTLWDKIVKFVVTNWLWLVIAVVALILFITIIALIARAAKKKREREEQRRLEEKEEKKREQEERKLEREERMARMSQAQPMPAMMPQMMPQMMGGQMPMPQGMPQAGGQTVTGGASSDNALLIRIETDIAAMKAAQEARDIAALKAAQDARELAEIKAEQSAMRSDINALRGSEQTLQGNITLDKLTELIELTVEKVLERKEKPAAATPENAAAPAVAQVPPDAVMTTVTTTKIDTTKKPAQNAQAAAPVRTVVRNVVAPMPVDDGRVFDVGGFYTPADPMTDMGFTNEENKD